MKILFTFMGGNGHFVPLVAVAQAAAAAGHTVAFGCGPSMVATVTAAGFVALQLGTGSATPPERLPLRPLDANREDQEFRDHFARKGARSRVPLSLALCQEWQPDVLVCDETDFGSMLAAELFGIPYASVLVMAAGSFVRPQLISDTLNELRLEHNLPPDPKLDMLHRYLVLSPFPPSFRDPAYPLPANAHSYRPLLPSVEVLQKPVWLTKFDDGPLVYFTLGTVFNMESGDLFTRVLNGLRQLSVNVLVTIGRHLDPAELGPQPANVYIERYIPQELILPHCQMIVSHGGSGSVSGALLHGRPSVLIPMGADQPLNAVRCVALGLGLMLDPVAATPESVRAAVAAVLNDPRYEQAAARIRDEFVALPEPGSTIPLLEQLRL